MEHLPAAVGTLHLDTEWSIIAAKELIETPAVGNIIFWGMMELHVGHFYFTCRFRQTISVGMSICFAHWGIMVIIVAMVEGGAEN